MRYETLRARLRLSILPLTLLALPACVGVPPIVASPSACSSLLPDEWRAGVPGADLPQGSTVGDWIAYADAQTGQLDKANDRTRAAIGRNARRRQPAIHAAQVGQPRTARKWLT